MNVQDDASGVVLAKPVSSECEAGLIAARLEFDDLCEKFKGDYAGLARAIPVKAIPVSFLFAMSGVRPENTSDYELGRIFGYYECIAELLPKIRAEREAARKKTEEEFEKRKKERDQL